MIPDNKKTFAGFKIKETKKLPNKGQGITLAKCEKIIKLMFPDG